MKADTVTDAELLLLGLVAEMPRHGYELEQIIEERGMREWTQIGFSSIYFVLGKLKKAGYITAEAPAGKKAKKVFSVTPDGRAVLIAQTIAALSCFRPTYPSLLLGMMHWPLLAQETALAALEARKSSIGDEVERLESVRFRRQPMPDFIEALFDFSNGQLAAESAWLDRTLDYMKTKP